MAYRPQIDGLRAIAVIVVVIFHAFPALLPGGYVGVDVFFVISGFLITAIIRNDLEAGNFSLLKFYAKRARRLLPASLTVFFVSFLAAAFVMSPDDFRHFGRSLTAATLFFSNIYFAGKTGYFDAPAHDRPLLHTWSLSIEEQFYIAWAPLLLLLVPRLRTPTIALGLVIVCIPLIAWSEYMAQTQANRAYFATEARIWELLVGATLAFVYDKWRISKRTAELLVGAGLVAIFASVTWLSRETPFPGIAALPACLGTAAILLATQHHNQLRIAHWLTIRPLVFIGLISYSLYLWHWPVLTFGRLLLERTPTPFETVLLIALAGLLAVLSWRYIEQPFRRGTAWKTRPPLAVLARAGGAMAVVIAIGISVNLGKGWAWRLDEVAQKLYEQKQSSNPFRPACYGTDKVLTGDARCNFGVDKPDTTFELAIFGDSNADHFVPALAIHARELGLKARQVTESACGPLIGVNLANRKEKKTRECMEFQSSIVAFVEQNPDLKLVVLSANWQPYAKALRTNSVVSKIDTETGPAPGSPTTLEPHLRKLIAFFKIKNIDVHLISQIPYQHIPVNCILKELRSGQSGEDCGVDVARIEDAIGEIDTLFEKLAAEDPSVTATIPSRHLCGARRCRLMEDGMLLYKNVGHLNAQGARKLAPIIKLDRDRLVAPITATDGNLTPIAVE
ncbi:MAG: acyltransferase family protein [Pseudomonadota bacterium]